MGTQLLGTPPPLFLAPILLYSCLTHTVLKPLTRAALESCQVFSVTMGPNLAPQPSLSFLGKKMAHFGANGTVSPLCPIQSSLLEKTTSQLRGTSHLIWETSPHLRLFCRSQVWSRLKTRPHHCLPLHGLVI